MSSMPAAQLRRIGFVATLATGVTLLGASVWGMAGVESRLAAAVAPQPQSAPPTSLVADHPSGRACDRPPHERERRLRSLREHV
jgi:hypothetical protein